jgi:hypothetical protein
MAIRTRELESEPEGISIGSQGILIGSLGQAAVLLRSSFHRRHHRIELLESLKQGELDTARKSPAAGSVQPPGATKPVVTVGLEQAEYDRADKGKRGIRGNNAQFADKRTQGHRETSVVHVVARINRQASKRFPPEKVSAAVHPRISTSRGTSATWLKSREINALKSP